MIRFVGLLVMEHASCARRRGAQHRIRGAPAADARRVAARRDALIPALGISGPSGFDGRTVAGLHLAARALVRRRIAESRAYVGKIHSRDIQSIAAELG